MMKKFGWFMGVAMVLGATLGGCCKPNEAATEACKTSADTEKCSECCKTNKATGHSFTGEGSCKCIGGQSS